MLPRIVRSPVDICLGTSPSQAPKSRPLENTSPVPIAATMALEMIRTDARHRHQARTCRILTGQCFDLAGEAIDALIQPAPVACQLLDDTQHAWRQGIGARCKDGG